MRTPKTVLAHARYARFALAALAAVAFRVVSN